LDLPTIFMKKIKLLAFSLTLLISSVVFAQSPYAMEPATPASELPKALVDSLNSKGVRVSELKNGVATPICEVWWTKSVASHPVKGKDNSHYAGLATGALVGVLHFFDEGEDSRDQKMQAGFYTLRYANVDADPEHSDNGAPQDAVLATPLWADKHVDKVMNLDELLRVSKLSAKTKKPVVINLMPINPAYKDSPSLITDDQGNCAVQVITQATGAGKPADIAVSILLVTPVRENGDS
jgi:hypothetical protein